MNFVDKVVIVTGAGSGIGAATAVLFSKEGADLAIVDRNQCNLQTVAKQIEKHGRKALIIVADLTKEDEISKVVSQTVEHYGLLNVLINCAGICVRGCILDGKLMQAFDETMNTNVRAVMQLTLLASPHLIKTKGNIVNVSSIAASTTNAIVMSYRISKSALDHFTRCAASELASSGVRVNSVNPGPVDSPFLVNNRLAKDEYKRTLKDKTALGRLSSCNEVGRLILFLASEESMSITGCNYPIDNGYLLNKSTFI